MVKRGFEDYFATKVMFVQRNVDIGKAEKLKHQLVINPEIDFVGICDE